MYYLDKVKEQCSSIHRKADSCALILGTRPKGHAGEIQLFKDAKRLGY